MPISIVPRLNYRFTPKDFIFSVKGLLTKNSDVERLETIFETDRIYFYNHARTAMRIALTALQLKSGAKIGIMAFNCLTVMNSVRSAGFDAVFIDVTDNFQMDLNDLEKKIANIDALIVNHMFGIPNRAIMTIREKYPTLPVIEDCAHSFMSKLEDKYTGLYGDLAVFSYGRAKFPTVGDGGFMVVNDEKYKMAVERENKLLQPKSFPEELKNILNSIVLSALHQPFIYKNISLRFFKSVDDKKDLAGKYSTREGSFYKSNKSLFLAKLKEIDVLLEKQTENGRKVKEIVPSEFKVYEEDYNYFMFPVLMNDRDHFISLCFEKGIELGKHFSKSIQWAELFGYQPGDCPNAEKIARKIITIPTYYQPGLKIKTLFNL